MDSRIFEPSIPSLLHLCVVQIALALCKDFDFATLKNVYENITAGIVFKVLGSFESESPLLTASMLAEDRLLCIPPRLREKVIQAVHGLTYASRKWQNAQDHILQLKDGDCNFQFKFDGSIDGKKNAQTLVLDTNYDIRKRFALACKYCLEETIQTLWAEMEESGEARNLGTGLNFMMRFWIRRVSKGSQIPWTKALKKLFNHQLQCLSAEVRLSSIFKSLLPKGRKNFLFFLERVEDDELLECLFAMSKEEEEMMMKENPVKLLDIALEWPLRSRFFEIINKIWKYIDKRSFRTFLDHFFEKERVWKDFDHYELFQDFWSSSPVFLRESVKRIPLLSEKIDLHLKEIRKREKILLRNLKKLKNKGLFRHKQTDEALE